MSLIALDIELTEENIIKELGLFLMVLCKEFNFVRQRLLNLINTTWHTSYLHGIAWSSGKLEYEKLFAVFYDIKVMNAEMFAKGFEKCRLLNRLLGEKVENLDDFGCPKIQDLVREGRTNSSWICSSCPLRHKTRKTRLQCAEREAKVYGDWAMQILYVCVVFVFTTILILST